MKLKSKEENYQQIRSDLQINNLVFMEEIHIFIREIVDDETNFLKVEKKVSGKKLSGFDAISRGTFWSEFMTLTFLSGLKFK